MAGNRAFITDVSAWLRKAPPAVIIRCTCPDGVVRTIRVDSKSSRKWVDAEDAIVAMRATNIEALDGKGNSIRLADLEGAEDPESAPAAANVQQSDLAHFASLLSKAYENGARATETPTKMAFETLGQLVQLVLKRLQDIEARQIRQLNAAQRALEGAGASGDESPLMGMLAQFMAGANGGRMVAAATVPAPPAAANGEAEETEEDDA